MMGVRARSSYNIKRPDNDLTFLHRVSSMKEGQQWIRDERGVHDLRLGSAGRPQLMQSYLRLPGTSGAFAYSPDAASLRPSTELDIEVDVALDNYATVNQTLVGKYAGSGNRAYIFRVSAAGALILTLTADGSAVASATRTPSPALVPGQRYKLRVTWRGSDNRVQFFVDGAQVGADSSIASVSTIFASTAPVEIGTWFSGSELAAGRFYSAKVSNTIGGAPTFDADFSGKQDRLSFLEATGKPVRLLGVPANITSDGLEVPGVTTGDNGVVFVDPSSMTGGVFQCVIEVTPDNWPNSGPSTTVAFVGPMGTTAATHAPRFQLDSSGNLRVAWEDGGGATRSRTVAHGLTGSSRQRLRLTLDTTLANTLFTAEIWDGSVWTTLGTQALTSVTGVTLASGSVEVGIGRQPGVTNPIRGTIHSVQYGTPSANLIDIDFETQTPYTRQFTEGTGKQVYISQTTPGVDTNDPTQLVAGNYLALPGVGGNYAGSSAITAYAGKTTGTLSMSAKANLPSWRPSSTQGFCGSSASQVLYLLLLTTGILRVRVLDSTITVHFADSTVALPDLPAADMWVRVDVDMDANTATFWYSTTATNDYGSAVWTQLGATVAFAPPDVRSTNIALAVGQVDTGTAAPLSGRVYQARWLNDGAVVASPDFTDQNAVNPGSTSMVDAQGNVWTLNRATSGKKLALVRSPILLFGTDDYLETPNHSLLNFEAGQDFTVITLVRGHGAGVSTASIIAKKPDAGGTTAGWILRQGGGVPTQPVLTVSDAATVVSASGPSRTSGVLHVIAASRIAGVNIVTLDGLTVTTAALNGSLINTNELRVARYSGGATSYNDMEFVGSALARRAFHPYEIALVGKVIQAA